MAVPEVASASSSISIASGPSAPGFIRASAPDPHPVSADVEGTDREVACVRRDHNGRTQTDVCGGRGHEVVVRVKRRAGYQAHVYRGQVGEVIRVGVGVPVVPDRVHEPPERAAGFLGRAYLRKGELGYDRRRRNSRGEVDDIAGGVEHVRAELAFACLGKVLEHPEGPAVGRLAGGHHGEMMWEQQGKLGADGVVHADGEKTNGFTAFGLLFV